MGDKLNSGKDEQIGVRLTAGLKKKVQERAKEADYSSVSDYIVGLIRYDLARRQPHALTAPLSKEPPSVQEDFEKGIMAAYNRGGAVTGTALDLMVEQLFTDPVREEIAANFREFLREKLSQALSKPAKRKRTRAKK